MKYYIGMFIVLALWCAFLPCLQLLGLNTDISAAEGVSSEESGKEHTEEGTPCFSASDTKVVVYIADTNTAKRYELKEYVADALAGVMAAESPTEALKAQAIVIRSLALNRKLNPKHEGFDLCTDPFCCYPVTKAEDERYLSAAALTEKELLCYEGAPIMGLSHLSSCISTEPYGDKHPYLSCISVEDESGFDCYKTLYSYSAAEFAKRFCKFGINLAGDHSTWIGQNKFTAGNRIDSIAVGEKNVKGTEFASALGLDSLCFTVNATKSGFDVLCYGSGSGYGMSRCSAMLMAATGADYTQILSRFYPQAILTQLIC